VTVDGRAGVLGACLRKQHGFETVKCCEMPRPHLTWRNLARGGTEVRTSEEQEWELLRCAVEHPSACV
jgi:hypothetical protein